MKNLGPSLEIINHTRERLPKSFMRKLCVNLYQEFSNHKTVKRSRGPQDFTLVFVGKAASQKLNKTYRKKNYPTDVLSFSSGAGAGSEGQGLGELVICVPVIKKQAKEHGLSFKEELSYMVIHGFLHLLGYDHEKSRKEELKMMKLQDRLFSELCP